MIYKKLKRVFEFQCEDILKPELVIFGPHADYIKPFGSDMLHQYGIQAFPFTRKKAADLGIEKVMKLGFYGIPTLSSEGKTGPCFSVQFSSGPFSSVQFRFIFLNFVERESCLFLKGLMLQI